MAKWILTVFVACFCIGVVDCGDDSDSDPLDCEGGRYDESAGLCWQHPRVEGSFNCEQAIDYCEELDMAGHTDWVLPTYHDFTLMLGNCGVAAGEGWGRCDSCYYSETCRKLFGSDDDDYWSSSYYDDAHAWYFGFDYGEMHAYFVGEVNTSVRCVRSVSGTDSDADSDTDSDSDGGSLNCEGGRYDESTGLCWQHPRADGLLQWEEAIDYCEGLDLAGYTDWVLPEYTDFIDMLGNCTIGSKWYLDCDSCGDSDTCDDLFGSDTAEYWSSSTSPNEYIGYDDVSWFSNFGNGSVETTAGDRYKFARCVRSVSGTDSDSDSDTDDSDGGSLDCDGGRYDESTDLCWQHPKAEGYFSWQQAIYNCKALNLGGHANWVLPTRQDFIDLLGNCDESVLSGGEGFCDSSVESDTCGKLFGWDSEWYWSSSPDGDDFAWFASFGSGNVSSLAVGDVHSLRCVRPGP